MQHDDPPMTGTRGAPAASGSSTCVHRYPLQPEEEFDSGHKRSTDL